MQFHSSGLVCHVWRTGGLHQVVEHYQVIVNSLPQMT